MITFVFFTKGRSPKRIKAENHIKACELFYEQNPDFHLSELLDIREANTKQPGKNWLGDSRLVKQ